MTDSLCNGLVLFRKRRKRCEWIGRSHNWKIHFMKLIQGKMTSTKSALSIRSLDARSKEHQILKTLIKFKFIFKWSMIYPLCFPFLFIIIIFNFVCIVFNHKAVAFGILWMCDYVQYFVEVLIQYESSERVRDWSKQC